MSRIGKMPIKVPAGVTVEVRGDQVQARGPQGELARTVPAGITVTLADGTIQVARASEQPRHKALHGLTRTLIANMVEGVASGFTRTLEIQGVGYKAEVTKTGLTVVVGYSHPVHVPAPAGIKFTVENNTVVKVAGPNKELVGQVAAELRSIRPPEPYKGKGIRYQGEQVRRKAGKTGAK
ncbi:MAG TPA: 50S ribosomal protein L6 [Gemmatimonadales bacterium]|nr:50S ribosomal protein L6 [Gemmatimonadales bacterium]